VVHPNPATLPISYTRHRFPAELIRHCVWLYHRFGRSLRDVQALMAVRGVAVPYETVHQWCRTFGPSEAQALRQRRSRPGDTWYVTWYVDDVQLTSNGRRSWLWRAVGHEGMVLDLLVQERRTRSAA
jgi:putative transposase